VVRVQSADGMTATHTRIKDGSQSGESNTAQRIWSSLRSRGAPAVSMAERTVAATDTRWGTHWLPTSPDASVGLRSKMADGSWSRSTCA
jgi:hypothetical protein